MSPTVLTYGSLALGAVLLYFGLVKTDRPYTQRGLLSIAGVGALAWGGRNVLIQASDEGWIREGWATKVAENLR